ncbi:MAG: phosphoribosylformylglycinamidine synthase subunit PurQ [Bacteroidota bacterium]|nr:phosphoribosylformylglycinamidine synthase subunit PurQ [Bacteroidota bacterium]MDP4232212.1 phosphoribosylformylglycinamidine synthase subunit PurQ [Bacteroidota bacterium]MDP4243607.1 phosphoribosylformylglycinamidine synthase subunit PurQ [Bacteroidota bacterium]MDP4288740.1 phosphoribosylformylglycinamidine synthase subunit PurQ [Bacteroidota bacterium]
MKTRIIVFPGSNCDHDAMHAVRNVLGEPDTEFVWHKEDSIGEDVDLVILPGGFSYGDYLRTGAIARFSPVMKDVIRYANEGGTVLGICNGFQVLCESGLLPGVLIRNESLKFVCKETYLKTERTDTRFTSELVPGEVLRIPIAHGEGNYIATDEVLADLEQNNQVVFRYSNENGNVIRSANPNGSQNNIAGIVSKEGNVLGMMPHPERACETILGSADGLKVFQSLRDHFDFAVAASQHSVLST